LNLVNCMKIFASTLLAMGVAQAAALESSPPTDEQLAQKLTLTPVKTAPLMITPVKNVAMPTMASSIPVIGLALPVMQKASV